MISSEALEGAKALYGVMDFKCLACTQEGRNPETFYMRAEDFRVMCAAASIEDGRRVARYKGLPVISLGPKQYAETRGGYVVRSEDAEEIGKVVRAAGQEIKILAPGDVVLLGGPVKEGD